MQHSQSTPLSAMPRYRHSNVHTPPSHLHPRPCHHPQQPPYNTLTPTPPQPESTHCLRSSTSQAATNRRQPCRHPYSNTRSSMQLHQNLAHNPTPPLPLRSPRHHITLTHLLAHTHPRHCQTSLPYQKRTELPLLTYTPHTLQPYATPLPNRSH